MAQTTVLIPTRAQELTLELLHDLVIQVRGGEYMSQEEVKRLFTTGGASAELVTMTHTEANRFYGQEQVVTSGTANYVKMTVPVD